MGEGSSILKGVTDNGSANKIVLLGSDNGNKVDIHMFKEFIASRTNNTYPIPFDVPPHVKAVAEQLMADAKSDNKPMTLVNHLPLRDKVILCCDIFISAYDLVTVSLNKAFVEIFEKATANAKDSKCTTPSIFYKVVALGWTGQDLKLGDDVDILRSAGMTTRRFVFGHDDIETIVRNFAIINPNLLRASNVGNNRTLSSASVASLENDFNKGTDVIRIRMMFITDLDNIQGKFKLV